MNTYIIAAIQQPTAALGLSSDGISIRRLPDPHSRAMYTSTGTATAATTTHTDAQHDFNPSVFIMTEKIRC
jgi:hypothetical protein